MPPKFSRNVRYADAAGAFRGRSAAMSERIVRRLAGTIARALAARVAASTTNGWATTIRPKREASRAITSGGRSRVHENRLAGDRARAIGQQEDDRRGDVLGAGPGGEGLDRAQGLELLRRSVRH